jgi:hypothetical protein
MFSKLALNLKTKWHKIGITIFIVIALSHIFESDPETSEWLQYNYTLMMLGGLMVLRPGFYISRYAHRSWSIALYIQIWQLVEYSLLLIQRETGNNLFDSPVPTSILNLILLGIQPHFFYNVIVLIPVFAALYFYNKRLAFLKQPTN